MNKNKIKMEQVDKDSWIFVWPSIADESEEYFSEGLEYMDSGDVKKAQTLFNKALSIFADHIDIIYHLSLLTNNKTEATRFLSKALEIGKQAFVKEFNISRDKLEWGFLENRPFLRVYYKIALDALENKQTTKAIEYFKQILTWNPNDNQGARIVLADIYANKKIWKDLINLYQKYKGDCSPSLAYGYSLALFKSGEIEEATKILKKAIKYSPLCAKELLKTTHKKPISEMSGYISMGGEDEAYEFWENQGKAWQDKKVKEWLTENVKP